MEQNSSLQLEKRNLLVITGSINLIHQRSHRKNGIQQRQASWKVNRTASTWSDNSQPVTAARERLQAGVSTAN